MSFDVRSSAEVARQGSMTIIARFEPENMTADKYAQVMRSLADKGLAAPTGRIHHTSYGPTERLCVLDVWDTPEHLQAFGAHLMPLLGSLGIVVGEPVIEPVHNIVR